MASLVAIVLNENFEVIRHIEDYTSFIWNEQFIGAGDFELEFPASDSNMEGVGLGYYVSINESDRYMIVEKVHMIGSFRDGNIVRMTGRTLESILDRRVLVSDIMETGMLKTFLTRVLNETIFSPADPNAATRDVSWTDRAIPSFTSFELDGIEDQEITIEYKAGEYLYNVLFDICNTFKVGYRVLFDRESFAYKIVFYTPEDRSYNQTKNPWVVFSNRYENLDNTDMSLDTTNLRNVAMVINRYSYTETETVDGEEVAVEKTKVMTLFVGDAKGLDRREIYVGYSKQPESIDKASFGQPTDRVNRKDYTVLYKKFDQASYRQAWADYEAAHPRPSTSVVETTKTVTVYLKPGDAGYKDVGDDYSASWVNTRKVDVPMTAEEIQQQKASNIRATAAWESRGPKKEDYYSYEEAWATDSSEAEYIAALNKAASDIESEYRAAVNEAISTVYSLMRAKGQEELAKYSAVTNFEGVVDHNAQYIFGRDYGLGDMVQIVDAFNFEATTRITGIMISQDNQNGYMVTPTFKSDDPAEVNYDI